MVGVATPGIRFRGAGRKLVKIGIITDSHLCPPGTPPDGCHNPYAFEVADAILTDAVAAHVADGVDAIAVLGDLANRGDLASMERALGIVAAAGVPFWLVGGNHDRDEDPGRLTDVAGRIGGTILDAIGREIDGIRVAALRIVGGTSARDWTVAVPDIGAWGTAPVLLLSHFPVVSRAEAITAAGFAYVGSFANGHSFVPRLLERSAPTLAVHGHLHLRDATVSGSLLQISCASLIEPPHERTVLEIEWEASRVSATVHHVGVFASPGGRSPVLTGSRAGWAFDRGEWHGDEVEPRLAGP